LIPRDAKIIAQTYSNFLIDKANPNSTWKEKLMKASKCAYLTIAIIVLAIGVFASKAMAQETSGIGFDGWGIRAGLTSDPDQVYGGVHFDLGEFTKDVRFRPSVEVGFGDDRTLVQMLAEVHYVFSTFQPLKPYAGAGLGLTYVNYDDDYPGDGSETGGSLNAIGGVETKLTQGMTLFFEVKVGLAHDDPDLKFGVGLSW
jgi:opacity protein-like surface antigen